MERDDDRVLDLFIAAVREAGGVGRLVRDRHAAWLPAVMESAYVLMLQEEEHRELEEIADLVGTTRDAVERILTGPAEDAHERLAERPPEDELVREHIAGGLVRYAYTHGLHIH